MKRFTSLLVGISLIFNLSSRADEGMWLLSMLDQLNMGKMTELGLELSAEEIYSINNSSLKDAIVIFGGGCTGELVSDEGLLLTNHHCGYGRIQAHSSTEHNYLEDGFWAMTKEEELANPGLKVTFLVRLENVSDRINDSLTTEMTEDERNEQINNISAEIENEATEGNHYQAKVKSYFGGNNFYLLVYEIYKDVRLVGAPPSSIGKYGYDTDNWEWPRHTGDFSIFRVYMSPDGKPAEYSEDNVPYKPKHYLPVSVKGVKKGDFAMVLGYPGGTQRYMTSFGIDDILSIKHPIMIKVRGARQEILWKDMLADEKVMIQYASKYSGSSNYWKNSIGQKKGLEKLNVKAKKQETEKIFTDWVNADATRKDKYGEALNLIESSLKNSAEYNSASWYLMECILRGSEIISFAGKALTFSDKLEAGNADEIEKAVESLRNSGKSFFKNYNAPTDHKASKLMLNMFAQGVPAEYQPTFYYTIAKKYKGNIDEYVDRMFEKSIFADEDRFNAFLDNPKLKSLNKDIAFQSFLSTYMQYFELADLMAEYSGDLKKGRRLYIAGLREMDPDLVLYPDANFTMRLSYGTVDGYNARDAVYYDYYTTLEGVMEKEDPDNYEFIVDEKLKELYKKKDYGIYGENNTMPVCFLTNNDITGGNSGSPMINAKGELIGLAFDGNWEAMSGDIAFEPELQRTIGVDIRYVLFIIDKIGGATQLIEEMDLVTATKEKTERGQLNLNTQHTEVEIVN